MGRITSEDPAGQNTNRQKASRALLSRLRVAERETRTIISDSPDDPSARQMNDLRRSIQFALNNQLLQTQDDEPVKSWYWTDELEQPYRQGALQEAVEINRQVRDAIIAGVLISGIFRPREIEAHGLITSKIYRDNFGLKVVDNFSVIKGLSETTTKQVMQQINIAMQSKLSVRETAVNIHERFNVSRSSAQRIAHTEINKSYNDARITTIEASEEQTGIPAKVEHLSALLTTTRGSHARRHGNFYTPAEQQKWWNTDANRINCYCSIRSSLEYEKEPPKNRFVN